MTTFLITSLAVFSIWFLCFSFQRRHQRISKMRADFFSESSKVITIKHSSIDSDGYQSLMGYFTGSEVKLCLEEAQQKQKGKSAVIWLHITLYRYSNTQTSLGIVVRPAADDGFKLNWHGARLITPLKSWPQDAHYTTRGRTPVLQQIEPEIRALFADQQIKALSILPETLTLTYAIPQPDITLRDVFQTPPRSPVMTDSAEIAALIRQLQALLLELDGGTTIYDAA